MGEAATRQLIRFGIPGGYAALVGIYFQAVYGWAWKQKIEANITDPPSPAAKIAARQQVQHAAAHRLGHLMPRLVLASLCRRDLCRLDCYAGSRLHVHQLERRLHGAPALEPCGFDCRSSAPPSEAAVGGGWIGTMILFAPSRLMFGLDSFLTAPRGGTMR